MTKFIFLRGPSGSGKSTTAEYIIKHSTRNIFVVEQDYFQNHVTRNGSSRALRKKMMINTCLMAFENDHDVILEGILSVDNYSDMFEEIIRNHPKENYSFYYDIPFDETVRRHATRYKAAHFGQDEMKEWYHFASPMGHSDETVISQAMSIDEIIKMIDNKTQILGKDSNA